MKIRIQWRGNSLGSHRTPRGRQYLDELMRVLPYWPSTRYNWAATRARLDPKELAELVGPFTVPEPA